MLPEGLAFGHDLCSHFNFFLDRPKTDLHLGETAKVPVRP